MMVKEKMRYRINTKKTTERLGDFYGIFFEDLNHAADGGLYAEMVQNRSFEYCAADHPSFHSLSAWEPIENGGKVRLVAETGAAVSEKNPHYLGMDILYPGKDVGVWNLGYEPGMVFEAGKKYRVRFYAKREQDLDQPVAVSLRGADKTIYASREFRISEVWECYETELEASATDFNGRLSVTAKGRGKVYLDFVSLFPEDTFLGRENGLRRDIAELLRDLKPRFMRFPGGCLVHDGSLDASARDAQYRWKNSVGPLEQRPARRNNWGYSQTLGLGYFELFQFCEDIGAKPLPVIPAGYDPHHHRAAPLDKMQPFIEDALDLIEFANGDVSTFWGNLRASMGHPAPFGLEYLGIGNEEVGEEFFVRYEMIHRAVREKYPQVKLINTASPFAAGGEYERGWESARRMGSDLIDEHYYMAPEWMLANHHRYDEFNRDDPKVFLGEYASWGNTWYHALTEASYMIGLERNAHAVGLACYAPLLCHSHYVNWQPDLIWFDNHRAFGTANYYVQKLFMNHQGDWLLETKKEMWEENEMWSKYPDRLPGAILLSCDDAQVTYEKITVENLDTGETMFFSDCSVDKAHPYHRLTEISACRYRICARATEKKGYKGMKIFFGYEGEEDWLCFSMGGWQNMDMMVTQRTHGKNSDLAQYAMEVQEGRTYDLEILVNGRTITTFVDGRRYHQVISHPVEVEPLYVSSSVEEVSGDILVKLVNVTDKERLLELQFEGLENGNYPMEVYEMAGFHLDDGNDFEHPRRVVPSLREELLKGVKKDWRVPPQSVTVLRVKACAGGDEMERKEKIQ